MDEEDFFDDIEDVAILAAIESDEDDDGDPRQRIFVDIEGFRRLDGASFVAHFRMERGVFQKLVGLVGNHLTAQNRLLRIKSPLDVGLLMTIWMLSNPDTFRSCGSQFGVSKSVVFHHYSYMIEALRELAPKFIKWPSEAERDVIKMNFEDKYGYPGVVGCVDGTHVNMTAPLQQPQRYVNRHHNYSLLVQAVCDHRLLFRDVFIGQPGSVGDARMFSRSPLSDSLLTKPDMILDEEHLLGDGAYILTKHVLVPYVDDGQLTHRQRTHNYILSSARSSVERSFALLKGKFRRLKLFPNYNMHIAIDHIIASIMLHNFIILNGDEPDGLCGNGNNIYVHDGAPHRALMEAARNEGMFKREYIARLLSPDD